MLQRKGSLPGWKEYREMFWILLLGAVLGLLINALSPRGFDAMIAAGLK